MKEKKSFKFKKIPALKSIKKYSAYLYLGAAVVAVVIMAVSIYSVNSGSDISVPEISVPSIQLPDISKDDTPVANNPTDIPADVLTEPEYYYPAEGNVITAHSTDALVFSPTMQDYRTHNGVDIAAEAGSSVVCYTDGKITAVYKDAFYGNVVEVLHDNNITTVYANLSDTATVGVAVGAQVKAGQVLGKIGDSAIIEASTQPHLHFEVKVGKNQVNPEDYLKNAK